MDYYDDFLNVYAYLFHKDKEISRSAIQLTSEIEEATNSYRQLDKKTDTLLSDIDQLLSKAYALAEKKKIDVSDLRYHPKLTSAVAEKQEPVPSVPKVRLPYDFDFQKDFQRLAKEARDAGFTNVHPEHLLTPEEMQHAEAFAQKLDDDFRAATQLQKKDIVVLIAAVAVRVVTFFLTRALSFDSQTQEAQDTDSFPADSMAPTVKLYGSSTDPIAFAGSPVQSIDALQGVDLGGILSQVSDVPQVAIENIVLPESEIIQDTLLSPEAIWSRQNYFVFPETPVFKARDIMANNPVLGWFFGVLNILTDTITTTKLKSFHVNFDGWNVLPPAIGQQVSTVSSVIKPVMENAAVYKDSVISAVMQEAKILGFCKADSQQLYTMFERAQILENKLTTLKNTASNALSTFKPELLECIEGIGISAFLNTLVSAIHAITYDEKDGDLDTFCIRTNRIVVAANAIGAMINSTPSLLAEDWKSLDYAGFITAFIAKAQSDRFWIDVKANFLVSAYGKEIQKEMKQMDQYFEFY